MVSKKNEGDPVDDETTGTPNAEIQRMGPTEEELRAINSVEDALSLFDTPATDISDVLGTGFEVISSEEKSRLVGTAFVIIGHTISNGDQGEFSSIQIVTKTGEKLVVNDGSTGIHAQLARLEKAKPHGAWLPMVVNRGLRSSNYTYTDPKTGKESPATTYYLNTSR